MKAAHSDRDRDAGTARVAAAAFAWLLLAGCTAFAPKPGWVKAGVDKAATQHQVGDCRAQANAARGNEHAINQDINATLGGNWQRARTSSVVDQSLRYQTADYADQVFDSCMRAKGFKTAK